MGGDQDGVFGADAESSEPLSEKPDTRQRGVERNPHKYVEMGRAAVGIGNDGMPVMQGELPFGPQPGLTDDNLICLASEDGSRKEDCEHYTALLVPADGEAKGFAEMRQIRRFCRFLATASELWEIDGNVYACSSRKPADLVSLRLITDFEKRQRQAAREAAEKSGSMSF